MEARAKQIGSFAAKGHSSKVLEDVEKGEENIITRRREFVAKIFLIMVLVLKSEDRNLFLSLIESGTL